MISIIHESKPKARKNYSCDACEFIFNGDYRYGYTFTEFRAISIARRKCYRIVKGEKYIRQYNSDSTSGETYTFRAIPEIHEICIKYRLYDL